MYSSSLPSPIGILLIEADDLFVRSIQFVEKEIKQNPSELTEWAKIELSAYFEGKLSTFTFPMQQDGSPFQQGVWQELQQIKPGHPISYTELAKRLQNPLAIRAIAATNGKNKLLIAIPCHRVIGSKGDLVGYAGKLWRKEWLLKHEVKMTGIGQTFLFL
jgi:methylated-DNA-[protein]-cysteine S-methyltransferase